MALPLVFTDGYTIERLMINRAADNQMWIIYRSGTAHATGGVIRIRNATASSPSIVATDPPATLFTGTTQIQSCAGGLTSHGLFVFYTEAANAGDGTQDFDRFGYRILPLNQLENADNPSNWGPYVVRPWYNSGTGERRRSHYYGNIVETSTGRIIQGVFGHFNSTVSPDEWYAAAEYSDNGGSTWTRVVIRDSETVHCAEGALIYMGGVSLCMVSSRTNGDLMLLAQSDDNGETWTALSSTDRGDPGGRVIPNGVFVNDTLRVVYEDRGTNAAKSSSYIVNSVNPPTVNSFLPDTVNGSDPEGYFEEDNIADVYNGLGYPSLYVNNSGEVFALMAKHVGFGQAEPGDTDIGGSSIGIVNAATARKAPILNRGRTRG